MDKEQHIEADEQHVPATPSPGQVLREAREEQGLTQQAIADKLYLKVGIIADIEENHLDDKMSVTFIKGYVRLYAKTLGIKTDEVLALFDQYHTTPKPPAKLQSFSRRVARQAHDDRWMMVTYGIAIVLIAGVVVWWYQQPANDTEELTSPPVKQSTSSSVPAIKPAAEPQANGADSVISGDDVTPENTYEEAVVDDIPDEDVLDSTADSVSATVAEENEQDTSAGAPVELVFRFKADCWVNITDASGEAVAYGIKAAGYEMTVAGMPPFEVTLGAPDVVQISYDGDAVDMSGFDPTRTAKFMLPMQD